MQGGDKYGASAPGVMHLAADQIFANIEERNDTDFLLRCSYLEVYNEQLRDLNAAAQCLVPGEMSRTKWQRLQSWRKQAKG